MKDEKLGGFFSPEISAAYESAECACGRPKSVGLRWCAECAAGMRAARAEARFFDPLRPDPHGPRFQDPYHLYGGGKAGAVADLAAERARRQGLGDVGLLRPIEYDPAETRANAEAWAQRSRLLDVSFEADGHRFEGVVVRRPADASEARKVVAEGLAMRAIVEALPRCTCGAYATRIESFDGPIHYYCDACLASALERTGGADWSTELPYATALRAYERGLK